METVVEGTKEEEEQSTPMEVDSTEQPAATTPPKRKKKKKANYKNMMAGMMQGGPKDIEKQKEKLREVTGGGTFSKIDKIWNEKDVSEWVVEVRAVF